MKKSVFIAFDTSKISIAKKIIAKGIDEVAFDRGKYKYHGLIKILADAARVEGLNF